MRAKAWELPSRGLILMLELMEEDLNILESPESDTQTGHGHLQDCPTTFMHDLTTYAHMHITWQHKYHLTHASPHNTHVFPGVGRPRDPRNPQSVTKAALDKFLVALNSQPS